MLAPAPEPRLEASDEILSGQFANGMTYITHKNAKPKERVMMMLSVKVGREDESLAEQGVSHLIEHLVANGSDLIEGQTLEAYLKSQGLNRNKNALTSDNRTSYFLYLPTDNSQLLTHGYDVFEDWATQIVLSDESLQKERGIVLEEYRTVSRDHSIHT